MGDLIHLIEYISVDVLLIGVVFSLFLVLSWSMLNHWQEGVCRGISKALDYIGEPKQRSWLYLAVLVVLASQLGTVLVRLSDEVLDSDAITAFIFLYVPAIGDISDRNEWGKNWKEEDLLKLQVIRDGLHRADFAPAIKGLLRRHLPPPEGFCFPPRDEDDCAKGFFQHANAVVIGDRGSDAQRDELRHEKYIVYLLSVLFVGIWILILPIFFVLLPVAFCQLVFECYTELKATQRPRSMTRIWGISKRLVTAIFVFFLLWCAEGFILRLWTEQSVRYNRRLLHAYVNIAGYGDPAMGIENGETQDERPEE